MRYAFIAAIMGVLGGAFTSLPVMTLVALKLGGKEVSVGLLSFASLTPWFASIFTMPMIEYLGKRKVLLLWHSVSLIFVFLLLFLPWLAGVWSKQNCLIFLFVVIFLRSCSEGMGATGWFPILHDIVPARVTGRFFGNLRTAWQSAGLLGLLVIAFFLGNEPEWWQFEILFLGAGVAWIGRSLSFIRLHEKPPLKTRENKSSVRKIMVEFYRERSLRPLIGYLLTYGMACTFAEPFKIKLLKDLGYSEAFIIQAYCMINAGAILSLWFWGRLADKYGNRSIFSVSHFGMIAVSFFWFFYNTSSFGAVLVFVLYFLSSVFNSGNGIAQTRYIMHAIASDKQNYITMLNVLNFSVWGIAPLAGGVLLKMTENVHIAVGNIFLSSYQIFFIIAAALYAVPHILRRRLHFHKDRSTVEVLFILMRPFMNLVGPFVRSGKTRKG